ncbi:sensor histidine kinase [Massilibacterium senegalense]|uniref:sensor histidine kinase n=1 Tax=Massilibacterium senegalense TaxID=1632858 RepID=UPI00078510D8|nr:ATP-binding protein [Massilibacterium senegalense]
MFWKIRKKLTFYYTFLLVLFLIAFSVISFLLLTAVNYYDKKEALSQLLEQAEHEKQSVPSLFIIRGEEDEEDELPSSFVVSEANYRQLQEDFQIHKTISFQHEDEMQLVKAYEEDEKVAFLLMKHHDHIAGVDVSAQLTMGKMLAIIFAGLTIIFSALAAILGLWMSKKAMVPIATSFQRQREFVADASHELRTPLAILHSSLEVLEAEEELSLFSKQIVDDMKDETKRMTALVGDLLTLARADSDAIQLEKQTFSLPPVVDAMTRSFQRLADKKEISFLVTRPDDVVVYADEKRIQQLFYILLDNAMKYTPTKGTVYVQVNVQNDKLIIEITDSGIGISKQEISRIFDRFYRVDKARSRKLGGSGLGLSIAQWIVDAHHGTITVQSVEQQGTTFHLTLPIVTKEGATI